MNKVVIMTGGDDKMNSSSWILNKWREHNGEN
jgi:hypothetical protein